MARYFDPLSPHQNKKKQRKSWTPSDKSYWIHACTILYVQPMKALRGVSGSAGWLEPSLIPSTILSQLQQLNVDPMSCVNTLYFGGSFH